MIDKLTALRMPSFNLEANGPQAQRSRAIHRMTLLHRLRLAHFLVFMRQCLYRRVQDLSMGTQAQRIEAEATIRHLT